MFLARTLSGRLLLLTVIIVMVTEVFIFLPSVARFREDFLMERLKMAQIASLALLAAEDSMVEDALEEELLANAGVSTIVLRRDQSRQLILRTPLPGPVEETFDLRDTGPARLIYDAMRVLIVRDERVIRVLGQPELNAGLVIEMTMNEGLLCEAMLDYGRRILLLSLLISTVTGVLIFFACRRLIVRPMERVVDHLVAFQNDPDGAPVAEPSGTGVTEIGRAEAALAEMQTQIKGALRQKSRLADLGLAVSKISHDLRNILSSAQLFADRLGGINDPVASRIGPKLVGSIGRAVTLCEDTLRHGKAEESPPEPRRVALSALVEEVGATVFEDGAAIQFDNAVPEPAQATGDPEHLFRILVNLSRNARQAMETSSVGDRLEIAFREAEGGVALTIRDNGPGMPPAAREQLFKPFVGSTSRGGSGLGLAIAAELATANRGRLSLVESERTGTVFELSLPR